MKSTLHIGAVVHILGHLLIVEAVLLLLPLLVCIIYGENDWYGFAAASAGAAMTGALMTYFSRRTDRTIRMREGFVITVAIWIFFGLFGMIPLMTAAHPLGFTDAMFEIISGFTTTGVSAYRDVEVLSHGVLFWRALSQWIGGLGIIMFVLAFLPEFNRTMGISLYNAEATGISHGKIHPRIRQTSLALWSVYSAITIAGALLMWAGPMNLFDSICHSFSTVATGGFSTRNAGPMGWDSAYINIVIIIEMFVSGLNFMLIYQTTKSGPGNLFKNDTVRVFTAIVAVAFVLMMLPSLTHSDGESGQADAIGHLFMIVSAVTSTGFAATGFESWGSFAFFIIVLLMLCGACTGSTSGGIKTDRFMVVFKNIANEIKSTLWRKRVYVVNLNGSVIERQQMGRLSAFIAIYLCAITLVTLLATFNGFSFGDSVFMTTSCIGCNGLGYGITGAEGSYALLPYNLKWALTFLMLVGRLELFAFLVLLVPSFWKR